MRQVRAGPRGFAHTGLTDGDQLQAGLFTLRALATQGHSPEHLSYLLFDGGSLMVGTASPTPAILNWGVLRNTFPTCRPALLS